jgi:hypothetical protein
MLVVVMVVVVAMVPMVIEFRQAQLVQTLEVEL